MSERTPNDTDPLEGNRAPATLELEYDDDELQLRVTPKTVNAICDEHRRAGERSYTCGLTHQQFTAPIGGVVWRLERAEGGCPLEHWPLHPDVVASGPEYIRRAAREEVMSYRRKARCCLNAGWNCLSPTNGRSRATDASTQGRRRLV